MASKTKINWCDATWNPWIGCSPVSAGCNNCYAASWAKRFGRNFHKITSTRTMNDPIRWQRNNTLPRSSNIFVCSLSDFFHPDASWRAFMDAIEVMHQCPSYRFLTLTKRVPWAIAALDELSELHALPSNLLLGITAETQTLFDLRISRAIQARYPFFLSLEPLLSPICFKDLGAAPRLLHDFLVLCEGIIVGGETGPGARPMDPDWAQHIRLFAAVHNIPFTFKQHSCPTGARDHRLDGDIINQFPSKRKG